MSDICIKESIDNMRELENIDIKQYFITLLYYIEQISFREIALNEDLNDRLIYELLLGKDKGKIFSIVHYPFCSDSYILYLELPFLCFFNTIDIPDKFEIAYLCNGGINVGYIGKLQAPISIGNVLINGEENSKIIDGINITNLNTISKDINRIYNVNRCHVSLHNFKSLDIELKYIRYLTLSIILDLDTSLNKAKNILRYILLKTNKINKVKLYIDVLDYSLEDVEYMFNICKNGDLFNIAKYIFNDKNCNEIIIEFDSCYIDNKHRSFKSCNLNEFMLYIEKMSKYISDSINNKLLFDID